MVEPASQPVIPPAPKGDTRPKDVPKEKPREPQEPPQVGPKGPGSTSTASGKPTKFHRELAEFMSLPALAFELKGDIYPAYVWNTRITKHAYAWGDLAEKNPALKRKLQKMMEGGAYGALVMTGLGVAVPILAYYGLYPRGMINPFALSPAEVAEFEAMRQSQGSNSHSPFSFGWGEDTGADDGIPHPVT